MKSNVNLFQNVWRSLFRLATVASLVGGGSAAAEFTTDLDDCDGLELWPAIYFDENAHTAYFDQDGDGYAIAGADPNSRLCYGNDSEAVVPMGWVEKCGDLDDNDAAVHPRRSEVYANGIDDDCDGRVDETEFVYSAGGNGNTTEGFTMCLLINDPAVVEAWRNRSAHRLFRYVVERQSLTDTSPEGTRTDGYQSLTELTIADNYARASIRLSGLQPGLVMRARVQFYSGPYLRPVGEVSEWYYTTTDHNSTLGRADTRIVLQGLYERYLSQIGAVGYAGTHFQYGQRYGASGGNAWCSEFYSWVVDHELREMGERITVSELQDYFEKGDAYTVIESDADLIDHGHRGAYLACDLGLDVEPFHSTMFLAYDKHTGKIWTLNGNYTSSYTEYLEGGDEVGLREFKPGDFAGWGRITGAMLK